jgi:hypothetical protein
MVRGGRQAIVELAVDSLHEPADANGSAKQQLLDRKQQAGAQIELLRRQVSS